MLQTKINIVSKCQNLVFCPHILHIHCSQNRLQYVNISGCLPRESTDCVCNCKPCESCANTCSSSGSVVLLLCSTVPQNIYHIYVSNDQDSTQQIRVSGHLNVNSKLGNRVPVPRRTGDEPFGLHLTPCIKIIYQSKPRRQVNLAVNVVDKISSSVAAQIKACTTGLAHCKISRLK
jgi:hypothetical protein